MGFVGRSIYSAIIEGHLRQGNFAAEVVALAPKLVDATLELHALVMNNFLPSAVKFHYQFNLRELSAITQACASISHMSLTFCTCSEQPEQVTICRLIFI